MVTFALILLSSVIVLVIALGILYIYERGYRAGYAEGKNAEPYKLITNGWEIVLPDIGVIKLIRDKEADHGR